MFTQQDFPKVSMPLVDNNGKITQTWYQYLITLFNRTGGSQGTSTDDIALLSIALGDDVASTQTAPAANVTTITVPSSPFTYEARLPGIFWIQQGTYVKVSIARGSNTLVYGYVTRGEFPLESGDIITLEYDPLTANPTTYFIPA